MTKVLRVLTVLALFGVLSSALLAGILLLSFPTDVAAQMPPPPTKQPADTPTSEPPTEEPPTSEPSPEPSEEPTEEPLPEPSSEPSPEPPPQSPDAPPERSAKASESRPNPNCQAVVEGDIKDAAGRLVTGATVTLQGEGIERTMMTDDQGHYGFGGLCAGTLTVIATLPGGQESTSGTVEVDGRSNYRLDLGSQSPGASGPVATATASPEPDAGQTPTSEPEMPVTGFPGWPLLGVALLGALVLVLSGARRLFAARSQKPD